MAKRILVGNHGPIKENVIKAVAVSMAAAAANNVDVIYLIVPSKSAFSGGVIEEILGENATRQLLKGKAVAVKDRISLKLESSSTLKNSSSVKIALAAYFGARDLRVADGLSNLKCIVFLPWSSEDGEGWQQSWNAEISGEKQPEDELDLHPELEDQLNRLTGRINLSTGLSHPSDGKAAKEMFSFLIANSIPFEPADIRSWALRKGWWPVFAEDLYDFATKRIG